MRATDRDRRTRRGPRRGHRRSAIAASSRAYHRAVPTPDQAPAGVTPRHPVRIGAAFWVQRTDRLAEAVPLIRRLLDGERVTVAGRFYDFRDAIVSPRPVQARLPILIGGSGPTKTLPLVARLADLWNAYGSPDSLAASDAILRGHCTTAGRDPDDIERTVNLNVVVRSTAAAAARVWESYVAEHRPRGGEGRLLVGGPVGAVAEALAEYARVGFRHPILIFRSPWDLETIPGLVAIREALAGRS